MKLYQVGVTAQQAHPVYVVNGVNVAEVGERYIIDTNGKKWSTSHGYAQFYEVGDNILITHVHGTARRPYLHNAKSTRFFNEREL